MLLTDHPPLARRCRPAWTATATPLAALLLITAAGLRLDAAPRADEPDGAIEGKPMMPVESRHPTSPGIGVTVSAGASALALEVSAPPTPRDSPVMTSQTPELAGRVTDKATGRPLGGATVRVRVGISRDSMRDDFRETRAIEATTLADGSYRFTLNPEELAEPALHFDLQITQADHINYRCRYPYALFLKDATRGFESPLAAAELEPAWPISGTVLDPAGMPAAGVKVVAVLAHDRSSWTYDKAWTNALGQFVLPLYPTGLATIWILPERFEPAVHSIEEDRRGDLGTFRLARGIRLRGRVTDAEDRPVGGVFVVARATPAADQDWRQYPWGTRGLLGRSSVTHEDGTFTLDPLPPGPIEIRPMEVRRERFELELELASRETWDGVEFRPLAATFLPQHVQLEAEGPPPAITLRSVPHVQVEAQIVDSRGRNKGGAGFEAEISGFIGHQQWRSKFRPDPRGRFAMIAPRGLDQAQARLMKHPESLEARYRVHREASFRRKPRMSLGRLERDVAEFQIVCYASSGLRVRATTRDGRPIAGLDVAVREVPGAAAEDEPGIGAYGETTVNVAVADPEHRETRRQIMPEIENEVTVTAGGYKAVSRRVKLTEGQTEEIVFILDPK